jgi:hypothetical protein
MIELRISIDIHRNSIIIISRRQVSESAQEIGVSPENTHRITQALLRPMVSLYEVIAPNLGKLFLRCS